HLQLGRIATHDWSNCRVLDRLMLYERRIENSLHKTMRELERRQLIRQYQQQEAEQEFEPSPSLRDEAAIRDMTDEKNSNLKKQSQYDRSASGVQRAARMELKKQSQSVSGQNSATSYLEGDYDKIPLRGVQENKANLSLREQTCPEPVERTPSRLAPRPALGVEKIEKPFS
ncbi:MAG: hypothetical protein JXA81_00835, partial [Sedimentisphaerales bacterium]|nr:hypothetical protein [Sedimentisphaerales bacterium]